MKQTADRTKQGEGNEGFTLVELLVVLGIIALLAALVAPQVLGYLGRARTDSSRVQIRNLENALELYLLDVGNYPTSEQGLNSLYESPEVASGWRGPYLKRKEGLLDPWGAQYLYDVNQDTNTPIIQSLGRDKKIGGQGENADVSSAQ